MPHYGLIGNPLSHSFSKKYFEKKFEQENLGNHTYELFPIAHIGMVKALLDKEPLLKGFNITRPYKVTIIPFLDTLDDTAKESGAVNTVLIERSGNQTKLTGFNTDVTGFGQSLQSFTGKANPGALILGTGGASKAVATVLKRKGAPFLYVSRNTVNDNTINYESISHDLLGKYPLIIHATPLGTYPETETFPPIPYNLLSPSNYLFDLVYNPSLTIFIRNGMEMGCQVKNGLEMLYLQADAAFRIWNEH